MTYARDLILTLTILALVFAADNWPKPVKDTQSPLCMQPYYNGVGELIARQMVPCSDQIFTAKFDRGTRV